MKNGTGKTVIISKNGMREGVDIRGGGPASSDTPLLNPLMNPEKINDLWRLSIWTKCIIRSC